ncbi:MAG: hypothetical protein U1A23_00715, partial [Candidatus Sungbacteria bacterium]|nr:hypothetical protein [Candidatus Sungbacteria bacterium]
FFRILSTMSYMDITTEPKIFNMDEDSDSMYDESEDSDMTDTDAEEDWSDDAAEDDTEEAM